MTRRRGHEHMHKAAQQQRERARPNLERPAERIRAASRIEPRLAETLGLRAGYDWSFRVALFDTSFVTPLREQRLQLTLFRLREPSEEAFRGVVEADFADAPAGGERRVAKRSADFGK